MSRKCLLVFGMSLALIMAVSSCAPAAPTSTLYAEVKKILDDGTYRLNRVLGQYVKKMTRDFMWDFVACNWEHLKETCNSRVLAHVLAKRLALSLSSPEFNQVVKDLGGEVPTDTDTVHPLQYYIIPPMKQQVTGDLYRVTGPDGKEYYWIGLTPSCDLAHRDADFMLFARCVPRKDHILFSEWHKAWPHNTNEARKAKDRFELSIADRRGERLFYLPPFLDVQDFFVDLQQVASYTTEDVAGWTRLASLDTPFAAKLVARFTRYYGRQGAPDLDVDCVLQKVQDESGLKEVAATEEVTKVKLDRTGPMNDTTHPDDGPRSQ